MVDNMVYTKLLKRVLDVIISFSALFVLSPILIVVGVLVRVKLGSPIIFSQKRPGRYGKIFKMFKFRSMTNAKDDNGDLMPDSYRLTKFGKLLRDTSLDELPGLLNVLKGDMSIIGPRPLLVQYLTLYNIEQKRRHDVRPGITGYAQVNGRNSIGWEEKFKLDVDYVDNISFLLDCKIFFLTIKKVFIREGISSETSVTMEPFEGTKK